MLSRLYFDLKSLFSATRGAEAYGFKPEEVASLLGEGPCSEPTLRWVPRGEYVSQKLSPFQVHEQLGFDYLSYPRFASMEELTGVLHRAPWLFRDTFPYPKRREEYLDRIWRAEMAQVTITWFGDPLGYGVVANQHLAPGDFVGTYTGEVRRFFRSYPDQNDYCLHYPTQFWSLQAYIIDALRAGNEMRYLNHSDRPNLQLECLLDRSLIHFVFLAGRRVEKGEPLTFDYGEDFWFQRGEQKV